MNHFIDWTKDLYDQMAMPGPPSRAIKGGILTPHRLIAMRAFMTLRREWEEEAQWASNIGTCEDAEFFAMETAYVIVNSGMKAQIAWRIWERVRERLERDLPVTGSGAFGHPGKVKAIDDVWKNRHDLFQRFNQAEGDSAKLEFLGSLPWVGNITRYHLAKNFGLQVAKPDRWLVRVADIHGQTVKAFCQHLSDATGFSVPLVDTIIWRCCNLGAVAIEEHGLRPVDPWLIAFWENADLNKDTPAHEIAHNVRFNGYIRPGQQQGNDGQLAPNSAINDQE